MIMTITDNRIKALDDLGFEWSSGKSRKVNIVLEVSKIDHANL